MWFLVGLGFLQPDRLCCSGSTIATYQTHSVPFLQVYYRRERGRQEAEGEGDNKERVLTFSGNRSEGMLPGLHPYSVYNIFIRVLNSKGEGPHSSNKTFETPEGGTYTLQAQSNILT